MAGRLPLHRRYRRRTRDLQGDRIEDLIDAETSSDDAKRSKPAPDIFQAALDDRMSLPAADLHDGPGTRYLLPDGRRKLLGSFRIAILTDELHRVPLLFHPSVLGIRRRAALPLRR